MNRKENMILKLIRYPLNGSFDTVRIFIDNEILNVDELISLAVSYKCFAFAKYLLSNPSLIDLDSGDYLCNSIFEKCRPYICYLNDLCGIVTTAVESERIKKSTLRKFEESVAEKLAEEANVERQRYYLEYFSKLPGASREWFMDPLIDKISWGNFIELCMDNFPLTALDSHRMADRLVKDNDMDGMIWCSYHSQVMLERSVEYMIDLGAIEPMPNLLCAADRRHDYARMAQLSSAIIELTTQQYQDWGYFASVQRVLINNFYGWGYGDPVLAMVQRKLEDAVVGSHSAAAIANYIFSFGVNERTLVALVACGDQEEIKAVKDRYPKQRDGIDRAIATFEKQRITCDILGEMTAEQKISTLLYLAKIGDSNTIESCLPKFADLFSDKKEVGDNQGKPRTYQKSKALEPCQGLIKIEDDTGQLSLY